MTDMITMRAMLRARKKVQALDLAIAQAEARFRSHSLEHIRTLQQMSRARRGRRRRYWERRFADSLAQLIDGQTTLRSLRRRRAVAREVVVEGFAPRERNTRLAYAV